MGNPLTEGQLISFMSVMFDGPNGAPMTSEQMKALDAFLAKANEGTPGAKASIRRNWFNTPDTP